MIEENEYCIHSENVLLPNGLKNAYIIIKHGKIAQILDTQNCDQNDIDSIIKPYKFYNFYKRYIIPGVIDTNFFTNLEFDENMWENTTKLTRQALTGGVTMIVNQPLLSENEQNEKSLVNGFQEQTEEEILNNCVNKHIKINYEKKIQQLQNECCTDFGQLGLLQPRTPSFDKDFFDKNSSSNSKKGNGLNRQSINLGNIIKENQNQSVLDNLDKLIGLKAYLTPPFQYGVDFFKDTDDLYQAITEVNQICQNNYLPVFIHPNSQKSSKDLVISSPLRKQSIKLRLINFQDQKRDASQTTDAVQGETSQELQIAKIEYNKQFESQLMTQQQIKYKKQFLKLAFQNTEQIVHILLSHQELKNYGREPDIFDTKNSKQCQIASDIEFSELMDVEDKDEKLKSDNSPADLGYNQINNNIKSNTTSANSIMLDGNQQIHNNNNNYRDKQLTIHSNSSMGTIEDSKDEGINQVQQYEFGQKSNQKITCGSPQKASKFKITNDKRISLNVVQETDEPQQLNNNDIQQPIKSQQNILKVQQQAPSLSNILENSDKKIASRKKSFLKKKGLKINTVQYQKQDRPQKLQGVQGDVCSQEQFQVSDNEEENLEGPIMVQAVEPEIEKSFQNNDSYIKTRPKKISVLKGDCNSPHSIHDLNKNIADSRKHSNNSIIEIHHLDNSSSSQIHMWGHHNHDIRKKQTSKLLERRMRVQSCQQQPNSAGSLNPTRQKAISLMKIPNGSSHHSVSQFQEQEEDYATFLTYRPPYWEHFAINFIRHYILNNYQYHPHYNHNNNINNQQQIQNGPEKHYINHNKIIFQNIANAYSLVKIESLKQLTKIIQGLESNDVGNDDIQSIYSEVSTPYFHFDIESIDKQNIKGSIFKNEPPISDRNNKKLLISALYNSDLIDMVGSYNLCVPSQYKFKEGEIYSRSFNGFFSVGTNLLATWSLAWTNIQKSRAQIYSEKNDNNIVEKLVEEKLQKISQNLSINPAKILGITDQKGTISVGLDADFVVFDPFCVKEYSVKNMFHDDQSHIYNDHVFENKKLYGEVLHTFIRGKEVFKRTESSSQFCKRFEPKLIVSEKIKNINLENNNINLESNGEII